MVAKVRGALEKTATTKAESLIAPDLQLCAEAGVRNPRELQLCVKASVQNIR